MSGKELSLEEHGIGSRPDGLSIDRVCVCACTYKRPQGLEEMLRGLERQQFASLPRPNLHVVVADNEGSGQAREICEQFRERSGVPLTYVREPQRGISFARNACLDNIPEACEYFAFIDDDEVPEPDWLERLLEAQAATGADVVQGPVIPAFGPGAPQWLVNGRFLGWPRRNWRGSLPDLAEFQDLAEAYTNNALVRRSCVADIGLRFDPDFALSGGGDTHFFKALHAAGCRIVYAPRAVVTELVPPERATLWYRVRLEYRIAISPLKSKAREAKPATILQRFNRAWRDIGAGKMASGFGCIARSACTLNPDGVVVGCLRIAYGAGQFSCALGAKYQIYR